MERECATRLYPIVFKGHPQSSPAPGAESSIAQLSARAMDPIRFEHHAGTAVTLSAGFLTIPPPNARLGKRKPVYRPRHNGRQVRASSTIFRSSGTAARRRRTWLRRASGLTSWDVGRWCDGAYYLSDPG